MGRPPSNGGPAFRFTQNEVAEMEAILREHKIQVPSRDLIAALSEKFSQSEERAGKVPVQIKQVWNWFQNRRFALRSKMPKPAAKLTSTGTQPQPAGSVGSAPLGSQPQPAQSGKSGSENPQMEFEAKSARDGAWYDVQAFLSHRYLDTGELEVRVRCAGFGADEDEWVNVNKHVRQRSLPCESTECFVVLPGDLILCFQEGKEQALYFDAHVLDAQRRRHDVRGCRCRFLVRYDHDQTEEIVPLRKVCRRPETDHRLQQLHMNNYTPVVTQKAVSQPSVATLKAANTVEATPTNPRTIVNPSTGVVPVVPPVHSSPAPVATLTEPEKPETGVPTYEATPSNLQTIANPSANVAPAPLPPTSGPTPATAPPKVPESVGPLCDATMPTNPQPVANPSVNVAPVTTLPTSVSAPETAPCDPKQPESAAPLHVATPTNPQADVNPSVNATPITPLPTSAPAPETAPSEAKESESIAPGPVSDASVAHLTAPSEAIKAKTGAPVQASSADSPATRASTSTVGGTARECDFHL